MAFRYPVTKDEFLRKLQKMDNEGMGQTDILIYIDKVARHYGIRVRHDNYAMLVQNNIVIHNMEPARRGAPPPPKAESAPSAASTDADAPKAPADAPKAPADAPKASADAPKAPADAPKASADTPKAPADAPPADRRGKAVPYSLVRNSSGAYIMDLKIGPESDARPKPIITRLILSINNKKVVDHQSRNVPFYYECNGLVIDAVTWKALAVPPFAFNHRPSFKQVENHLNDKLYDIIKIDDGTVVTLYNWNDPERGKTWSMSSSNGYDVSSLYWFGPLNYSEVIYDLSVRLYPEFAKESGMELVDKRLTFSNLDTRYCYTFGFRHHNFHPMVSDPERIWQIQVANTSYGCPKIMFNRFTEAGLPHVPSQQILPDEDIYPRLVVNDRFKISKLQSMLSSAVDDVVALAAVDPLDAALESIGAGPSTPPVHNYGYILRSRDPRKTKECSDVMIESPLLARVRKIIYERAPKQIRDSLSSEERLEYNALKAFLTPTERSEFISLYPEWKDKFRKYEEFVNGLKEQAVHIVRQRAMAPSAKEPAAKSVVSRLARTLIDDICRRESITAFHKDTESILSDFIVDSQYTYLFLRVLQRSD